MQLKSKSRKNEEELILQMKSKGVCGQNAFLLGGGGRGVLFFVPLRWSTDWMWPTHISGGSLLYASVSLVQYTITETSRVLDQTPVHCGPAV